MNSSKMMENLDLEYAQRDPAEMPLEEESVTPLLEVNSEAVGELDPENIGYDWSF